MGDTYIHLPDDTYLRVPDGTDMSMVKSKLSARFPGSMGGSRNIPSPAAGLLTRAGGKADPKSMPGGVQPEYGESGLHNRPDATAGQKFREMSSDVGRLAGQVGDIAGGMVKPLAQFTPPAIASSILQRKAPAVAQKYIPDVINRNAIPLEEMPKRAMETWTMVAAPGIMEEGGLGGVPEGTERLPVGGRRPIPQSGSPAASRSTPPRPSPASSKMTPIDYAALVPGKIGWAAGLLKKFGIGEAPGPAEELPEDFGTPAGLRGKRVRPGTLDTNLTPAPKPRSEPAWKIAPPSSDTSTPPADAEAPLSRPPIHKPAPPRPPHPEPAWKTLEKSNERPEEENNPNADIEAEAQGIGPQRRMVGTPQQLAAQPSATRLGLVRQHPPVPEALPSAYGPRKTDFYGHVPDDNLGFDFSPAEDIGNKVRATVEGKMGPLPRGGGNGSAIHMLERSEPGHDEAEPEPEVSDDEWTAGHDIDTHVENTRNPSFPVRVRPNYPGEINPHPRQYFPEQDISDEALAAALKLKLGRMKP